MNVQGPTPVVFRPLLAGAGAATAPAAAAKAAASAPAQPAAPGAAEGSLWDVLTDEERAFFTQQARLGNVHYGPARAASAGSSAPIGQRVDVRG